MHVPGLTEDGMHYRSEFQGNIMNTEENFLTRYGLQHFVTCTQSGGQHAFVIKGQEGQKMIKHAESLIKGRHGAAARIQVTQS
jgi:hypothetical protein